VADPGAMRGWELGDGQPIEVTLLVDGDQAAWARHVIGIEGVTRPDGSTRFKVGIRNPEAFRSLAISFLDHAEVLAPTEVRADLVAWLEKLA
jgi:predicted DNA-binding transcriptional regulator YafY